jgi:hypothetical protein
MEVASLVLVTPGLVLMIILGVINLSRPAAISLLLMAILLFRQYRKK